MVGGKKDLINQIMQAMAHWDDIKWPVTVSVDGQSYQVKKADILPSLPPKAQEVFAQNTATMKTDCQQAHVHANNAIRHLQQNDPFIAAIEQLENAFAIEIQYGEPFVYYPCIQHAWQILKECRLDAIYFKRILQHIRDLFNPSDPSLYIPGYRLWGTQLGPLSANNFYSRPSALSAVANIIIPEFYHLIFTEDELVVIANYERDQSFSVTSGERKLLTPSREEHRSIV